MSTSRSSIESRYRELIDSMTPAERIARSAAMFQWTREQISRQISDETREDNQESLKWKVAMRLYGDQPIVRMLIQRKLDDVSG